MSVQVSQVILYRQQSIMQQCMESNPAWRFHCNHGSVHIEYVHAKHKKSRENINSSPPPEKESPLKQNIQTATDPALYYCCGPSAVSEQNYRCLRKK